MAHTTLKDRVLDVLKRIPKSRERKYKTGAVALILKDKYIDLEGISLPRLTEILQDADTLDRAWRKILQEDEALRGSDYADKEILEQEKQIELGYIPTNKTLDKRALEKINNEN